MCNIVCILYGREILISHNTLTIRLTLSRSSALPPNRNFYHFLLEPAFALQPFPVWAIAVFILDRISWASLHSPYASMRTGYPWPGHTITDFSLFLLHLVCPYHCRTFHKNWRFSVVPTQLSSHHSIDDGYTCSVFLCITVFRL